MAHFTHGGEHHRILVGEFIDRRDPVAGEELRQPVRGVEFFFKEVRRSLIRL
ncbi:Uncharacterised protein [Enterobacter cloacae]|nr:Uncharacterised protein [Enterobacter cloacae]